jgi:hypothetical protein
MNAFVPFGRAKLILRFVKAGYKLTLVIRQRLAAT